jgi:hypothetical protein
MLEAASLSCGRERCVRVASRSTSGAFGHGEWAVMGNDGVVHLAETSSGLPSSGARCGAVGTAFMVSTPEWDAARICHRCVALAQADAA